MNQEHQRGEGEKQLSSYNRAIHILKFTLLTFKYKNSVAWKKSNFQRKEIRKPRNISKSWNCSTSNILHWIIDQSFGKYLLNSMQSTINLIIYFSIYLLNHNKFRGRSEVKYKIDGSTWLIACKYLQRGVGAKDDSLRRTNVPWVMRGHASGTCRAYECVL